MAPFWILCVILAAILVVGLSRRQRGRSGPTVSELLGLDLLLSDDDHDLRDDYALVPAAARRPRASDARPAGARPAGTRPAGARPAGRGRSGGPGGAPVPASAPRRAAAPRPEPRRSAPAPAAGRGRPPVARTAGRTPGRRARRPGDDWRDVRMHAMGLAAAGRYGEARRVVAPYVDAVPEAAKLDRAWRASAA